MIRLHIVRTKLLGVGLRRRRVLAILVGAVTLAVATFLGTAHLKLHGHFHCTPYPLHPSLCIPASSYWVVGRYAWQIPVAIVVGAIGLASAVALARRT
jgi:hypothetical protein